jgi:hypothetical protein
MSSVDLHTRFGTLSISSQSIEVWHGSYMTFWLSRGRRRMEEAGLLPFPAGRSDDGNHSYYAVYAGPLFLLTTRRLTAREAPSEGLEVAA